MIFLANSKKYRIVGDVVCVLASMEDVSVFFRDRILREPGESESCEQRYTLWEASERSEAGRGGVQRQIQELQHRRTVQTVSVLVLPDQLLWELYVDSTLATYTPYSSKCTSVTVINQNTPASVYADSGQTDVQRVLCVHEQFDSTGAQTHVTVNQQDLWIFVQTQNLGSVSYLHRVAFNHRQRKLYIRIKSSKCWLNSVIQYKVQIFYVNCKQHIIVKVSIQTLSNRGKI